MSRPLERCLDLESALALIQEALRSSGTRWKVTGSGTFVHSAKCTLYSASGHMLAIGQGKGEKLANTVGAIFEATEHYWSRFEATDQSRLVYCRAGAFAQAYPALLVDLPLALIDQAEDAFLPFRSYEGITTRANCLYPLGLSTPSYLDGLASGTIINPRDEFDYRCLARYSTNSGVAIGANRTEAAIHGLLECVERDSLSGFMANVFLTRRSAALRVVARATLPADLSELAFRIEKESGRRLTTFELENRFGIPAFCTVLESDASLSMLYGSGASLSQHHALARSLYEVAQVFLIKTGDEWDNSHDTRVLQRLKEHPFLLRCAKLDLPAECRKNGFVIVSYEETAAIDYPTKMEDYLTCISGILDSHGATAFTTTLATFENGVNVSHSFFVGQDYFFLVGYGNVVLPQRASVESARDYVYGHH